MFEQPARSGSGDGPIFDVAAASDEQLLARAVRLERDRTQLDVEQTGVLAAIEERGLVDPVRALATGTWLAWEAKLPVAAARNRVKVSCALHQRFPEVLDALAAGIISWEHARVLVDLANPRILDVVVENQSVLVGLAQRCQFEQWRAEVRDLARLWDQDGGYDPNADPNANRLSFGTTIDGLTSLVGTLTGADAEVVTQAIEARTDDLLARARHEHEACPELDVPSRRTARASALVELIREALATDPASTVPARPEATLALEAGEPLQGSRPDGVPLDDGTTRVLSCDADLVPLVVDHDGVPLHHGRTARLAKPAQRRAVRRRDGGCVVPGCTALSHWCDVHHCVHWDEGGVTDLGNLVSLCRRHHGLVHRTGWRVWLHEDGWAAFRTPSGATFWGQRHGRQRAGPPPAPPPELDAERRRPGSGTVLAPSPDHLLADVVDTVAPRLLLRRFSAHASPRAA